MELSVLDVASSTELAVRREKIMELEKMSMQKPQVDIPVKHYIHGGMYVREITIPKGVMVTGSIYKFDHFDIMISGDITVSSDDGESKRLKGYNVFEGMSGKKRAGYAHEDTTWITIHPFSAETGDEIQEFVTANSFDELEEFRIDYSKGDFQFFLSQIGMTEEQIQQDMDSCPVVETIANVEIKESPIQGKGVFATQSFNANEAVGIARTNGVKTTIGRYCNHSPQPNVFPLLDGDEVIFISNRKIEAGDEILANYRDILEFSQCQD